MATRKSLETPTVLAFERKLDPSDALLFSGNWEARHSSTGWQPVRVQEMRGRGTASHRQSAKEFDPTKLQLAQEKPNLVWTDVASLPYAADTLKIQFSLRVLSGLGLPCACNDMRYQKALTAVVADYLQHPGLSELAHRYATTLANGRFLWRNRLGAEEVEVNVGLIRQGKAEKRWNFQSLGMSLRDPTPVTEDLLDLARSIASGLSGPVPVLLQIDAFARVGPGQTVYPSQELVLERKRGEKSKWLYKVGLGDSAIAAMHSQKIGNALRTIDTWYPEAQENGPISIEPYGSVTTQGEAYRKPSTNLDFYSLLDNWVLKGTEPPIEQQHFVMATLIRGGVFGDASKE